MKVLTWMWLFNLLCQQPSSNKTSINFVIVQTTFTLLNSFLKITILIRNNKTNSR